MNRAHIEYMGETKRIDPNAGVGSPCRRTTNWAFIGYTEDGTAHPIGVYSTYATGNAAAEAWLRTTKGESFTEGTPIYEEMNDDV